MSFDSFSLLSPRIRRMMIIHSGESTQANNTQPSALLPLFLAMLAGMWIQKSHNTTKMATNTMIGAAPVICRYKQFLVSISTNVQNITKSMVFWIIDVAKYRCLVPNVSMDAAGGRRPFAQVLRNSLSGHPPPGSHDTWISSWQRVLPLT